MIRKLVTLILILMTFVLQCTVFRELSLGDVTPNLLMVLTVSVSFMNGDIDGMLTGFFGGLLVDIFFGNYLGFFALLYVLCGFFAGKLHRAFYPQNIVLPMLLITCFDFAFGFTCYVLMFMFRTRFDTGFYMEHVIIPETIYTIIAALFMYPILLWIHTSLTAYEIRNSKKFV